MPAARFFLFFKLSPSARTNTKRARRSVLMPRARSSAAKPRVVNGPDRQRSRSQAGAIKISSVRIGGRKLPPRAEIAPLGLTRHQQVGAGALPFVPAVDLGGRCRCLHGCENLDNAVAVLGVCRNQP